MEAAKQTRSACVIIKKHIKADREKIFEAWTNPEMMQQWLFPGEGTAKTSNDLRVGGKYTHDMIFEHADSSCEGETTLDGKYSYLHHGEYVEISRPERLVFTWNSASVKNTRVTVDFTSVGNGTEVCITHELFDYVDQVESHTAGWNSILEKLSVRNL